MKIIIIIAALIVFILMTACLAICVFRKRRFLKAQDESICDALKFDKADEIITAALNSENESEEIQELEFEWTDEVSIIAVDSDNLISDDLRKWFHSQKEM